MAIDRYISSDEINNDSGFLSKDNCFENFEIMDLELVNCVNKYFKYNSPELKKEGFICASCGEVFDDRSEDLGGICRIKNF